MILVCINLHGMEVYYLSNVVEKCLTLGNSKQRKEIVDEILNREDKYYSYYQATPF